MAEIRPAAAGDATVRRFALISPAIWRPCAVDSDAVQGDLAAVVQDTLEPAHVSVWLSERSAVSPAIPT